VAISLFFLLNISAPTTLTHIHSCARSIQKDRVTVKTETKDHFCMCSSPLVSITLSKDIRGETRFTAAKILCLNGIVRKKNNKH